MPQSWSLTHSTTYPGGAGRHPRTEQPASLAPPSGPVATQPRDSRAVGLCSAGPSGGGLAGWKLEGISRRSLWLVPVSRTTTRPRPRPAGAAVRRSWPCQSRGSAGCAGSPDWLSRSGCERDRTQGDPVGAKLSERVGVAERTGRKSGPPRRAGPGCSRGGWVSFFLKNKTKQKKPTKTTKGCRVGPHHCHCTAASEGLWYRWRHTSWIFRHHLWALPLGSIR